MYCQTCGGAVNPGLSYCNHCGARTSGEPARGKNELSATSFNLLVSATIAIPIVGLGIIMGLLVIMKKELGLANDLTFTVLAMSFLLLLTSEAALFWLLLTHAKKPKKTAEDLRSRNFELKDVEIKGLNEARQGGIYDAVPTVTEHTTRSLDAVPIETKKQ